MPDGIGISVPSRQRRPENSDAAAADALAFADAEFVATLEGTEATEGATGGSFCTVGVEDLSQAANVSSTTPRS